MSDDEKFDGLRNIWGLVGQIPTRGIFIAQFIGSSTLNCFIFGSMGGFIGQTALGTGPVLPFLVGSWAGFTLTCIATWKKDTERAVRVCQCYPRLVEHMMATEFANECCKEESIPTEQDIMKSLKVRTRMILIGYALQPAIDEIVKRRTEALKEQYASADE